MKNELKGVMKEEKKKKPILETLKEKTKRVWRGKRALLTEKSLKKIDESGAYSIYIYI